MEGGKCGIAVKERLINNIRKLMKKIMGVRISKAAESSLLINESQNGFKEGRTCSDNIFILNTMIEAARRVKRTAFAVCGSG